MKSPRSKLALVAAAALAALVAVSPSVPSTAQTPPPVPYLQNFDGYIMDAPLPYGANSSLDVLVHSRDRNTWRSLDPMAAEHGSHCEAPPATHQITGSYDDAVFLCAANPHLMTAMNEGGYGLIYLTPGALADFTDGETVIKFDVSTLRSSSRDWWDIWVTPFEDAMAGPLGPSLPDLSGLPKRGLHIDMAGNTAHTGARIENHVPTDLSSFWWIDAENALAGVGLTPSAQRRDTYELRISSTHVKFSLLSSTTGQPIVTWVDKEMATPLDWTKGIVQIGHHSYNPGKDCNVANQPGPDGTCKANTWHWDNISISRTSTLTMIPANERWANDASPTYTFPYPAPASTYLQVHALANSMEYSLDGGATWATLGQQASVHHPWGGRRTYWQAVPAGTTAVTLRGVEQTGVWDANHAVLLSQQPKGPPATPAVTPTIATPEPTNTPAPTHTPTNTPVPPTATPAPQGAIRINVGGAQYTDSSSNVWSADTGYSGVSDTYYPDTGRAIGNTTEDQLYREQRYSFANESMSYAISVANGTYTVTLKFAELYFNAANQRPIDVTAEGTQIENDLDVWTAAGGKDTALDRPHTVVVADGTLNLVFSGGANGTIINAIEVVQQAPPTPTPTPVPPTATPTPTPICRQPYDRQEFGSGWHSMHQPITCP